MQFWYLYDSINKTKKKFWFRPITVTIYFLIEIDLMDIHYLSHLYKFSNCFEFMFLPMSTTMLCKSRVWKKFVHKEFVFETYSIVFVQCHIQIYRITYSHAQAAVATILLSPFSNDYLNSNDSFTFSGYHNVFLHTKYLSTCVQRHLSPSSLTTTK